VLGKKLAYPAATLVLLSSAVGLHRTGGVHAKSVAADYSGTVAITDYQFPDSLQAGGAWSNGVADVEISSAMFETPLNFDRAGNFYADLVTEVPSTKNGGIKIANGKEIITLHFKPNLKWSDGTPQTAADYMGSMVVSFAPEFNSNTGIDQIQTITVSGSDMTITYKGLDAPALSYGIPQLSSGALLPVEYLQKKYGANIDPSLLKSYDADKLAAYFKSAAYKGSGTQKFLNKWVNDSYNTPADITNGPYKLAEWTQDQRVTMVPNTFYSALPAASGHPRPAKIQFVEVSTNPNALVQALKSAGTYGSIDKAEDFGLSDIPALRQSKYQVLVPDALFYEHLELNLGNAALKDVRVRQALYYGVSKLAYLRALYPGLSEADYRKTALTSPLPSTSPWSNNKSLPVDAYNPTKAKALLAAAGYGPGHPLNLNFVTTGSSFRIRSSQLLQRLWSQIGVAVRIRYAAAFGNNGLFTKYVDGGILYHRTFDIAEFAFSTNPDPDQVKANFEPQDIPDATHPTGGNYIGLNDPQITKDLDLAGTTLDDAARHRYYDDFQNRVVSQAYYINLFNRPNVLVVKGTIGNFKPNVTQNGNEWNTWEWFVDPSNSQKPTAS